MTKADEWGWWAGPTDEYVTVGPCATKEQAVQEALDAGDYTEIETEGGWKRVVHWCEARGQYFECSECGNPDEPCEGCREALSSDGFETRFRNYRNFGSGAFDYDDEVPQ